MPVQTTLTQVNTIATHTALSTWNSAEEFLAVLVLFGIFFLIAWYVGKGTFFSILIAFYPAYALYSIFPYFSSLPSTPPLTALVAQVGTFIAFTVVAFIILRRVVVSDFLYVGIIGMSILSFLGAGFVLALAYHTFPVTSIYQFTPAVNALFAPKQYFFWWFVAPLIGLLFFAH